MAVEKMQAFSLNLYFLLSVFGKNISLTKS